MTRVKLCGMTRPEDIACINRLQPEYAGFVFWPKSRRFVTMEQAAALKADLDPAITAVGVFVDEDPAVILALQEKGIISMAQLHGSEPEEDIRFLQSHGVPVIRAYQIATPEDVRRAVNSPADYIMFDPGKGDGALFNWQLILPVTRPYFLAGGLTPENVGDAIATLHPWAVDVSSGIESDGKKDPLKMERFVSQVRKEEQV